MPKSNIIVMDIKGFRNQVNDFATTYGLNARDVMLDQQRLWTADLIKRFAPPTLAKGRKAVKRDIMRVFVALDASDTWWTLPNPPFTGYTIGVKSRTGATWAAREDRFHPEATAKDLKKIHDGYRGKDGRVSKYTVGARALRRGGQVNLRLEHVPTSARRKFIRQEQKRVGHLKAGWVPAAIVFGAKVPGFVGRQSEKLGGSSGRGTMKANGSGYLESSNSVRYSRRFDFAVRASALTRQRDVERHLKKRIKSIVERENKR